MWIKFERRSPWRRLPERPANRCIEGTRQSFRIENFGDASGDYALLFGDSDERKDLFERTFTFRAKYLEP
jgi:hypothetical protein